MKDLKMGTTTENIDIDEAVFLMEGVYNKYVAEKQLDCDIYEYSFEIKIPSSDAGTNLKDVADAFWGIKENLLAKIDSMDIEGLGLENFDLELIHKAEGVGESAIKVRTVLKKRNIQFDKYYETCNSNFSPFLPNKVWKTITSTELGGSFANGQATIDHTTKQLVPGTVNYSLPGAAPALRAKGISNYTEEGCMMFICGYYVNTTSSELSASSMPYFPPAGTPSNQYMNLAIPFYGSSMRWSTKLLGNLPDDYRVYKEWITTSMMNYYLQYIPEQIAGCVAPGKRFSNMHIRTDFGMINTNETAVYHTYTVYSGHFIPTPNGLCNQNKYPLGSL